MIYLKNVKKNFFYTISIIITHYYYNFAKKMYKKKYIWSRSIFVF